MLIADHDEARAQRAAQDDPRHAGARVDASAAESVAGLCREHRITAINPVVAPELLATGVWSGAGVLGPEAFDAVPFLALLEDHGSPWGQRDDQVGAR